MSLKTAINLQNEVSLNQHIHTNQINKSRKDFNVIITAVKKWVTFTVTDIVAPLATPPKIPSLKTLSYL